jgi:hypothetical protein
MSENPYQPPKGTRAQSDIEKRLTVQTPRLNLRRRLNLSALDLQMDRRGILLVLACAAIGLADDDADREAAQVKRWRAFYQQRAEAFVVTRDDRPLELVPEPVQAYSNPVRSAAQHGTIHLWLDQGRPAAIGSIWSAIDRKNSEQRNVCYELHSLSESPLSLLYDNKRVWAPEEPGLAWQPLSGAAAPAKTRAARLTQMRRIVSELKPVLEGGESELRLLPQPVYRYGEKLEDAVDGAIFGYVMGTDPELFLLLEARPVAGKEPQWMFSPIRFTGGGLKMMQGEKVIWQSEKWVYERHKIYDFLFGVERLPAEWPAEAEEARSSR